MHFTFTSFCMHLFHFIYLHLHLFHFYCSIPFLFHSVVVVVLTFGICHSFRTLSHWPLTYILHLLFDDNFLPSFVVGDGHALPVVVEVGPIPSHAGSPAGGGSPPPPSLPVLLSLVVDLMGQPSVCVFPGAVIMGVGGWCWHSDDSDSCVSLTLMCWSFVVVWASLCIICIYYCLSVIFSERHYCVHLYCVLLWYYPIPLCHWPWPHFIDSPIVWW